jgi:hypothetical protein
MRGPQRLHPLVGEADLVGRRRVPAPTNPICTLGGRMLVPKASQVNQPTLTTNMLLACFAGVIGCQIVHMVGLNTMCKVC